jgi:hypothetical protein
MTLRQPHQQASQAVPASRLWLNLVCVCVWGGGCSYGRVATAAAAAAVHLRLSCTSLYTVPGLKGRYR